MRRLLLDKPDPIILCLGAHSDDIEIGAGATLVHLMEQAPRASIHWVVFSGEGKRADEGRSSAALLAHWRHDLHQDHRLIAELTGQTFRDHLILEYEILKYDGGLGSPNVYVPVSTAEANRKVDHLLSTFTSQSSKYWFTDETLRAFMRVRGVECRAPSGYAEAFFGSKLVFEGSAARDI